MSLDLVVTCALGLEELLAGEIRELGMEGEPAIERGAVRVTGSWPDVWRLNWRLRTANRVLVLLGGGPALSDRDLAAGIGSIVEDDGLHWDGLSAGELFDPSATFSLRATSRRSRLRDVRWIVQRAKDGLVDAQRRRHGRRGSIDRKRPDRSFRIWLDEDRASFLLDTTGEPLDRRGYRVQTTEAPLREQLAAACVLAAEWDGKGPVLDPMCGSGTLLAEAGLWALGLAPGSLRRGWAFVRLPNFDGRAFWDIQGEPIPAPNPQVQLYGRDRSREALDAARVNLERAGLLERCHLRQGDTFELEPPSEPGLLLVNPAYGQRLEEDPDQWRRLGDLFKQEYQGWRVVVVAGDAGKGKWIGLRPTRRLPIKNGALDARILVFDLY